MAQALCQSRYLLAIEKYIDKRKQYESMAYDIVVKRKSFSMEDTIMLEAKVDLVRNQEDTLYGGIFSIEIEDTLWYGYDGLKIMRGEIASSTLTNADPYRHSGVFVKSTWVDNFLDYGFLKNGEGPKALILNPDIKATFVDTVIGEWPCLGIYFNLPDEGDISNQTIFMAIDTIEYYARSRMYSAFFQGNEQYTNWWFKDSRYGHNTNIQKLDGTYESTFREIVQFNPDTTYETKPSFYDYKQLTGKVYNTNVPFRLSEEKANLYILDFWYTSCYPCIKGIPSVNRLYNDYKDKGVKVFGVNMLDDEVKSKARLEKFFKNNLMEYTPVMVDPQMADQIGIRAYPTLLVLDSNYQIIYMEDGFNEDLYENVSAILEERL
jgi:thiol-disulfide isomerase/thioredoxin